MVASNAWAEIIHHASDGILEERWLPGQMTDGAFVASLALLAVEAERLRPSAILIDATQFQYRPRACAQLCANATANNSPIPVKTKRVISGPPESSYGQDGLARLWLRARMPDVDSPRRQSEQPLRGAEPLILCDGEPRAACISISIWVVEWEVQPRERAA